MRTCAACKQKIADTSDAYRDHAKKTVCVPCAVKAGVVRP